MHEPNPLADLDLTQWRASLEPIQETGTEIGFRRFSNIERSTMEPSSQKVQFMKAHEEIRGRILILGIEHAQNLMNRNDADPDLGKLQAKATELLNGPDAFESRLTLSVVALLSPSQLTPSVTDGELGVCIEDAFDALAGVTPAA